LKRRYQAPFHGHLAVLFFRACQYSGRFHSTALRTFIKKERNIRSRIHPCQGLRSVESIPHVFHVFLVGQAATNASPAVDEDNSSVNFRPRLVGHWNSGCPSISPIGIKSFTDPPRKEICISSRHSCPTALFF
jgi:hypothetical protein